GDTSRRTGGSGTARPMGALHGSLVARVATRRMRGSVAGRTVRVRRPANSVPRPPRWPSGPSPQPGRSPPHSPILSNPPTPGLPGALGHGMARTASCCAGVSGKSGAMIEVAVLTILPAAAAFAAAMDLFTLKIPNSISVLLALAFLPLALLVGLDAWTIANHLAAGVL